MCLEKVFRKRRLIGIAVSTLIIGVLISFVAIDTVSADNTRPISWEEVENDGSYTNPEYAYDNEYNDTSTKADIDSPGGTGSESKIYESLAYKFNLNPSISAATLYYMWSTTIGHGSCWDGVVQIYYWNWGTSSWDNKGSWGDQALATSSLGITSTYISSAGEFKVKFLSKSGCTYSIRYSTAIDLYDVYVSYSILSDSIKPTIMITSPSNGNTLTSTLVTVTGTASDNVDVQKVEISKDETNWVLCTGTTSWSGTITLSEGSNTIYAKATDTSGNANTTSISVNVSISYEVTSLKPISWEEADNDGSYINPEYAYDNEYNDTSTKAVIESPSGTGSDREIYESLTYTFNLESNATNGTLYYTWSTSIGRAECWDGIVQIYYWNWEKSKWDVQGTWEDLPLGTRALPITSEYIDSKGSFKVKLLSKSGCTYSERHSSKIELYDLYVSTGKMLRIGEQPIEAALTPFGDLYQLLPIGIVCMIGLAMIHIKKQGKYIKFALSTKLSAITGIASFITVFGVFTFLNSGFGEYWEKAIVPSMLFVTVLMALLIGIVMGMFIFSIKKCGAMGRKERGVGMGGVIVSLIAAFGGCCGSIIVAFLGVGAAVFLTQYGTVFKTSAVALLFFSIILMARTMKKEEECIRCEREAK